MTWVALMVSSNSPAKWNRVKKKIVSSIERWMQTDRQMDRGNWIWGWMCQEGVLGISVCVCVCVCVCRCLHPRCLEAPPGCLLT